MPGKSLRDRPVVRGELPDDRPSLTAVYASLALVGFSRPEKPVLKSQYDSRSCGESRRQLEILMFGFATTRCGKCEKSTFKVQELSLKGELDYKMISVQCTYCKTPIGVIYNNALLQQQQARILRVERRLSSMEDKLSDIEDKLSEIASALSPRRITR